MKLFLLCLIIAVAMLSARSYADTVVLKNKHSINGIIKGEDERSIVLDVGCGTITFPRTDIESIQRSDGATNRSMAESWKKQYVENFPAPTPEDQAVLDGFKELMREKGKLAKKLALKDGITNQIYQLQEGVSRLQYELDTIGQGIKTTDPNKDMVKYNSLVVEFNATSNRLSRVVDTLNELRKEQDAISGEVVEYINKVVHYRGDFEQARADLARPKVKIAQERKEFYDNLREKLSLLEEDIRQEEVKFDKRGQGIAVTVRINNRRDVKMLVDTGASLTTISGRVASGLGINTGQLKQNVELVLADGSKKKAKFVMLDSVRVGSMIARNVGAAIIKEEPSAGIDGLLGMSFLSNFAFSINAEKQKIIFNSFK